MGEGTKKEERKRRGQLNLFSLCGSNIAAEKEECEEEKATLFIFCTYCSKLQEERKERRQERRRKLRLKFD